MSRIHTCIDILCYQKGCISYRKVFDESKHSASFLCSVAVSVAGGAFWFASKDDVLEVEHQRVNVCQKSQIFAFS